MSGKVTVAVLGAGGRMGRTLVRLIHSGAVQDIALAGALEADRQFFGQDAGMVAGCGETGVRITGDFAEAVREAAVLIDFTTPAATAEHARAAREQSKPMVIGTTGLGEAEMRAVRELAGAVAVVQSPNMSLGVNLLFRLVAQVASTLAGRGYDVEIVEAHHRRKKDAPSGTALRLADEILGVLGWDREQALCYGRRGQVGERPAAQIGLHAVRGGDIVGEHTVLFAGEGECLTLAHRATSRDAFGVGALQAARWVAEQSPGLYSMADVLGL